MISPSANAADELAVQQLRSFCLVFERQSYSAAAREIGQSVPAIWEQVRSLEARYRTSLFQRRGRRIHPTPAAGVLYEALRPLLAGLDSTFELLSEERGEFPRTISLVSGARMMLEDLAPVLARFHARYPDVRLRLLHYNDKVAADLIVAGEADLALTLEPGPGVLGREVCVERAYPIEYLAVFPKRHPLAKAENLRLFDLAGYPLILGHPGTYGRQLLEQALHHEGVWERVRIVAETDTSAFTVACVRAGMGVGIIAGQAKGYLCRGLATRSLQPELGEAWIAFLWKRGKHLTTAVLTLLDLIRSRGQVFGSQTAVTQHSPGDA
jgi:DNA-binding transcriptional LysR family regulator